MPAYFDNSTYEVHHDLMVQYGEGDNFYFYTNSQRGHGLYTRSYIKRKVILCFKGLGKKFQNSGPMVL
jgi:hypothetical protein